MELIKSGHEAFIRASKLIDEATHTIEIQMFIWRDDNIGNVVLEHVYQALSRGVKVIIKKDEYGSIFEKSEENKQSLFHKQKNRKLSPLIRGIDWMYSDNRKPKGYNQNPNPLLDKVLNHPNLTLNQSVLKDHTKYYIIDDRILFMGGVNIEDKEDGKDIQGRAYKDYMVQIEDEAFVKYFKERINGKAFDSTGVLEVVTNAHEPEASILIPKMFNQAESKIVMHMAYFGAKTSTKAILNALKKGIKVEILTSKVSNLQTHFNLMLLKKLYRKGASIYLYEGLVHAKAMVVDDTFIVGSTNLNNAAFYKLGECSLVIKDQAVVDEFLDEHKKMVAKSTRITHYSDIKYNKFLALLEKFVS